MAVPVQVTFRDLPRSEAVIAHVERRASKLDTFSERMVACHVIVSEPHRHRKQGERYHVSIEMFMPGKELVISRTSDDAKEDLHAAIDGAFDDAERVLEDFVRQRQADTKVHRRPLRGVVTKLFAESGYGFIEAEDGHDVYFHRNSVLYGRFGKLAVGAKVRYAEEDGDKGPQASTVVVVGRAA